MEGGKEIKRKNFMGNTPAYSLRNKVIFSLIGLTLGSFALAVYFVKPNNMLLQYIGDEQTHNEEKLKREQAIIKMRTELLEEEQKMARKQKSY